MGCVVSERRSPPGVPVWSPDLDRVLLKRWRAMVGVSKVCAEFGAMGFRPGDVLARVLMLLADPHMTDPCERAAALLWGHAVRDPSTPGGWRLDGRAVRQDVIIREANIVARALKVAEIPYPGVSS